MELGSQILFFLAGLGVFNGLLLALYFLFLVRPKKWANILFGLLMLMLCVRIGKSIFHVFADIPMIYRQIGLSACFMIGPFLFLYVRDFLSKRKGPDIQAWIHILIPLSGVIIIGSLWPYETNYSLWNKHFIYWIYGLWGLYVIATIYKLKSIALKVIQKESSIEENWIVLICACVSILWLAYCLAMCNFPYLAGPLLFSVVLYVLMGFLATKKNRIVILSEAPIKYQNKKINSTKANELLSRLDAKMQTEQIYLNPKIKMAQIAEAIDSTPHEVSQVINESLGMTFNQYINQFRVKTACILLKEKDNLTLEGIGREVGFHSRSAFYSAFKTMTEQTPGEYKSNLKKIRS